MFQTDQYELLDFGRGRKLERFGPIVLDRPSPAAERSRQHHAELWRTARARYRREATNAGAWEPADAVPQAWHIRHGDAMFELKPTEFGQVGLFAEQATNWDWIAARVRAAAAPPKVLNLFAYTGGSTLAALGAGAAEVTHVDAAKNTLSWARRNAEHSGLADAPVRWIPEDALRFAQRELRRGNRYDAAILDPPSYGHGPGGEAWKLDEHLEELLALCGRLTEPRRQFILLTCHTPGYDPPRLAAMLSDALGGAATSAEPLMLQTAGGASLPAGVAARWPAE